MLENVMNNFLSYLINNHPEIFLVTHDPIEKSLELIPDSFVCNVNEIDCQPSSVFNSDNCTEPIDPNDIRDISKPRILASNSDEMSKRGTQYNQKIISSEETGSHLPAESSVHFVDLENVKQTCETKWHSFFKEVEIVKESSLENCTFNQGKDMMSNSVETTGMKRQEKIENQEIQHSESYLKVIEACKTKWPSFLRDDKAVKVPSFKKLTFKQAKDRMSNSVQTTGIKLKENSGNQRIQDKSYPSLENDQREPYATSALKNLSISVNCSSSKKCQVSHSYTISTVKLSSSSHSDTISCEQIKVSKNNTDQSKSNSVNSSSVNSYTVSKFPHSSSMFNVEAGLSNSSHFPFSNKSSYTQIPERFLEHSVKLCSDSTGKLLDPRLNPNRKRKIINNRKEIVLKRVKWASDPVVLSNLKSSNKIKSHPKTCVVHSKDSAINSKISDPRLKHSKIFSKHSVPSFHKTKVPSSRDSVSTSPTPTPPRIHNHQHISSVVASNRNIVSNSLPNISPSSYPLKKRKEISAATSLLERCGILSTSPLKRRDISPSTSPLKRRDISTSTSPLKRRDISPSTSPLKRRDISTSPLKRRDISPSTSPLKRRNISPSTSPLKMRDISTSPLTRRDISPSPSHSEKLKIELSPNWMDDRSWTLPLKKRKLLYDVISSMECGKNSSSNKINILDNYGNYESISKSRDEAISTIEFGDRIDTVTKSLDQISAYISSSRNQTNKEKGTISCAASKIVKINRNTESSSRQDQTSDPVTIDTSKKDLDCMMKPTENSLLCKRWNSNVEEQHSLSNDVFFRNGYNYPVRSTSVNASICSRYSSINVNSKEKCFASELSSAMKRLHSVSPHAPQNKSIGINKATYNLKEYGAMSYSQWMIWREKYLKFKSKRQANKLVVRKDFFCDKTSSRTKQSDPNSHDSSNISHVQSSEMQTMDSLVPLGNYFDKEGILKIVHVCSQVEIVIISLKLPLKLVSKLCWEYYLNSLLIHLNRLISKEKLTSNPSSINILRLLLKYPFAKHLIRHSNNGLNGDLKYLLQAFKEHCLVSFTIAHEDIGITTEQNDETLRVNPSYVKSSIKPMNTTVDCNAFQNIQSESNSIEYVCSNSHTALPEAFSSDGTTSCYDSGMFDETYSINNTPLEHMKIQIHQNYETVIENTSGVNSNTISFNSVVDCNVLQNMPSESNNTPHVCLNFHTVLTEVISSGDSNVSYDFEMLDETEEIESNKISSQVSLNSHPVLPEASSDNSSSCFDSEMLDETEEIESNKISSQASLNSHPVLPKASSDNSSSCFDSEMLDETEEIESNKISSQVSLNSHPVLPEASSDNSSSCFDSEMLDETEEIESNKISSQASLNSHPVLPKASSDNSSSCFDSGMLDETKEIEMNKNIMHDEDIKIATQQNDGMTISENTTTLISDIVSIKSEEFECTVHWKSHPVLLGASSTGGSSLCYDSDKFDETEEKLENSNISSTFWLTLNSMWDDFFQFTELKSYFGSESCKSIVILLRKKGISFPILEHFVFLNYENEFISKKYRNCPVNYYGTIFTCRNFDISQGYYLLSKSCERLKAKYLCFKYFSTKISDIVFPVPAKIEEYETYYFIKTIENNFISPSLPQVQCFKQNKKPIPFNVDPKQNKKLIPYKMDLEQNKKPISYKVDSEKIKRISLKKFPQQNTPNHHKIHLASLKEIDKVCNIKFMDITVRSDTTSDDETPNNSDILDSSCTDAKYQKCTNQVPLCPKRLPSKNCPQNEILCNTQLPDTSSPRIFNSNCQLKNKRTCSSADIDALFQDFDLFKEDGVLDRYYKHLKGFGDHTVNFNLIEKTENDLQGIMFEMYRVLKEQLNYHKYVLRGLIDLASSSDTNDMSLILDIVVQLDYIKGYEIACKACLV